MICKKEYERRHQTYTKLTTKTHDSKVVEKRKGKHSNFILELDNIL